MATCESPHRDTFIKEDLLMAGVLDVGRAPAQLELQHLRPPAPQLQAVEGGLLAALHRLQSEPAPELSELFF